MIKHLTAALKDKLKVDTKDMRSFKLALNTSKFDPVNAPGISASMKIGITDEKQDPIKS